MATWVYSPLLTRVNRPAHDCLTARRCVKGQGQWPVAAAPPTGYPAALVRTVVTLLKMVLICVAIAGTTATAATATKPTISAYSTKSCPCVSFHKFLQNVFIGIAPFLFHTNIRLRIL